jgi:hypothetical protein
VSIPLPRQRVRVPMPVQTPLMTDTGTVSMPWLYYLMQTSDALTLEASLTGRIRTLLLHDTRVGTNIADQVPVYVTGTGRRILGVLSREITEDLTIRVRLNGTTIATFTIPTATAVGTVVESTTFSNDPQPFTDGDVLSWDVIASDGQIHRYGVASFTVEWTAA